MCVSKSKCSLFYFCHHSQRQIVLGCVFLFYTHRLNSYKLLGITSNVDTRNFGKITLQQQHPSKIECLNSFTRKAPYSNVVSLFLFFYSYPVLLFANKNHLAINNLYDLFMTPTEFKDPSVP